MKKRPDWTLCVKEGERWHKVGVAWNTERGNICVKLEESVPAGSVMAFPYREERAGSPCKKPPSKVKNWFSHENNWEPPGQQEVRENPVAGDPDSPSWL